MTEEQNARPSRPVPFEGRDELDAAWARYRKSLRRLLREGAKSDPRTLARVPQIAAEAAEVLLRLAADADAAADDSDRSRKERARQDAVARRVLQAGARRGSPRVAAMLKQLERDRAQG